MYFQQLFSQENPLILASQSPQRVRILEMLGIPFRAVPSAFEEVLDPALSSIETAELFATEKAKDVAKKFPDSFVVGVDTIVVSATGEILGKPKDEADARAMLSGKSGQTEAVISGICLITPWQTLIRHEVAQIHFQEFGPDAVEWMLSLREWEGKSGAISVEGASSAFIDRIEGNFWNIMGFPIPTFFTLLREYL